MSDNTYYIVPRDPHFIPDPVAQQNAVTYANDLAPDAHAIELLVHEKPAFFDAGGNFSKIKCPESGIELDMEWWGDTMDQDFDGEGFQLNSYQSPCGGRPLSLNQVVYEWNQAFARFALAINNPNIPELSVAVTERFSGILGSEVSVVYQYN